MEKPNIPIYTPSQKDVKDYGLGESIDVTINGRAVIPILADKIYKSPYSAIRELYVNEVTAVKKALRIDAGLLPEIHISINSNNRELIIKGVDSLGIDTQTFKYILAVMGNSGNNTGLETGYYGLGFYSFVKISERIIINSYSLESKEKWACIAKSALKFEKLPEGSYKPLTKTGFEITLSIKNELDINTIVQKVKDISKLSGVKTILKLDDVNINLIQYDNLEHYFKTIYKDFFDGNCNYSIMYEHINNDDFELIIGHKSKSGHKLQESYLINVPIELEFNYNMPQICLINVKNERLFKPSADRERFDEHDEQTLINKINEHNFEYRDKLPVINNLNSWYETKYRYFYENIGEFSLLSYVKDVFGERDYKGSYKRVYLKDILPLKKPKEFRISKTLRKKSFMDYENINIFACQIWDIYNYDRFIKVGFIDIDDGKKKRNNSSNNYNPDKLVKNFKFYNRYHSFDILPNNALCVLRTDNVRDSSFRNKLQSDKIYYVTERADYDTIKIDDLLDLMNQDIILATNKGFLTIKDIIELSTKFNVYENNQSHNQYRDKEERFMMYLFNYQSGKLIIHFENNDDSKLLETYLIFKKGYISTDNINFNDIEREINNKKHEDFIKEIKDDRLMKLIDEMSFSSRDDEIRKIFLSLQSDLK